jgi:gas vesicle protein
MVNDNNNNNNNNSSVFLAGAIFGGLLGTLTGILIAPRSGRDTRRLLKKSADALPEIAEDLSTTVQLQADRFSESARRNWQDTLDRLKETIAAGVEASQEVETHASPRDITLDSRSPENYR